MDVHDNHYIHGRKFKNFMIDLNYDKRLSSLLIDNLDSWKGSLEDNKGLGAGGRGRRLKGMEPAVSVQTLAEFLGPRTGPNNKLAAVPM